MSDRCCRDKNSDLKSIELMKYWGEFVIADCRVSPLPPAAATFIGDDAIDRILQKFIASLARARKRTPDLFLRPSFSPIGDPLSLRVNRALSRRKADALEYAKSLLFICSLVVLIEFFYRSLFPDPRRFAPEERLVKRR